MDSSYFTNPLIFLVQTLFGIYILIVMLRFLLQLFRADFYNPISQLVVKATSPVLHPLRRLIPGFSGVDVASLILMIALKSVEISIILLLNGISFNPLAPLLWSVPELVDLLIMVFLIAILIQVILSWVNPGTYSPATTLLHTLTEPLLAPARRLSPPISGLDLSPMVVMIGLYLLRMLILPPLQILFGSPFQ